MIINVRLAWPRCINACQTIPASIVFPNPTSSANKKCRCGLATTRCAAKIWCGRISVRALESWPPLLLVRNCAARIFSSNRHDSSHCPRIARSSGVPRELTREDVTTPVANAVYHCVDPRSGSATFTFARPNRPRVLDAQSDRLSYATFHLGVDKEADPLLEHLELKIGIDNNYIAHIDLRSTMCNDHVKAEIFDLEFTLQFPSTIRGEMFQET